MTKNLKLVPAIILFLFLFLITNATEPKLVATSVECKSIMDCPKVSLYIKRDIVNICMNGYCHRLIFHP
ncbi:unnamed protein product [Trifolium pratense]|uniref:Uncharacterized protein n=1 Tax=Trifolium pratense TaxID=57577 RepID=A0ACB0L996_TRIPR|nr:unnamed protein product [Trifolium pratense]